jgi:hypothetical protein
MESPGSGRRVRFGQFEMDEHAGELRKEGIKVRLQEQPLQILQILLQHPGEVVTREELRKRVWPTDTFVDFDHGINNAVKRLQTPQFHPEMHGSRESSNCDLSDLLGVNDPRCGELLPVPGVRRDAFPGTVWPPTYIVHSIAQRSWLPSPRPH